MRRAFVIMVAALAALGGAVSVQPTTAEARPYLCRPKKDPDCDRLSNRREQRLGTDLLNPDTDVDSLGTGRRGGACGPILFRRTRTTICSTTATTSPWEPIPAIPTATTTVPTIVVTTATAMAPTIEAATMARTTDAFAPPSPDD